MYSSILFHFYASLFINFETGTENSLFKENDPYPLELGIDI